MDSDQVQEKTGHGILRHMLQVDLIHCIRHSSILVQKPIVGLTVSKHM